MAKVKVNQPGLTESDIEALKTSIHRTPIATILTDNCAEDNPIVEVNDAFVALTGYPRDEIIGRNCRFLGGPGTEPEARSALRAAVTQGRPLIVELTNYRKDGTAFQNAVMLAPVLDHDGHAAMFIGSQMDTGAGAGMGSGLRGARAKQMVNDLPPRLRQTLELIASGYRNKQIGWLLGIQERTVKMHRSRLLTALGVSTSADAIRIAVEAGMGQTRREGTTLLQ